MFCQVLPYSEIIPSNIRPEMVEIIVRFSDRGLSHKEMFLITGVSQGDISKVLRHVQSRISAAMVLAYSS